MKLTSVIVILIMTFSPYVRAQCSDAGICSLKEHSVPSAHLPPSIDKIGISYAMGKSDNALAIMYSTAQLEGTFSVYRGTSVSFVLPFNAQSGPQGNLNGIGDLIALLQIPFFSDGAMKLSAQAGVKAATGNANQNSYLPQQYQPGLGTNDLLFGLTGSTGVWDGSIGYQYSTGRSSNTLTRLKRGDDAYLRTGYSFVNENLTVHPSLLFIQRLGKSNVLTPSVAAEMFMDVPGSAQAQLNGSVDIQYAIMSPYRITAAFAFPFFHRPVNVDGLTRAYTLKFGMEANL